MPAGEYAHTNRDNFEKLAKNIEYHFMQAMQRKIPQEETSLLMARAWLNFCANLENLPFIGDANPLTRNLVGAAYEMYVYLELEKYGLPLREISVLNQVALAELTRAQMTPESHNYIRTVVYSPEVLRRQAEQSQKRMYAGDWVFEYVSPVEDDEWAVGVTYTKCGIADLYKKAGYERLLPFICLNDYPVLYEMGIDLRRTMTLGNGACCCDFRMRFGDCSKRIITDPETLDEFKNAPGNHNSLND